LIDGTINLNAFLFIAMTTMLCNKAYSFYNLDEDLSVEEYDTQITTNSTLIELDQAKSEIPNPKTQS
jgi:hypothetical protein